MLFVLYFENFNSNLSSLDCIGNVKHNNERNNTKRPRYNAKYHKFIYYILENMTLQNTNFI